MTQAAAILEVRHVRLSEQATLRPTALGAEQEDGVFVAIDDPPPVRTVLAVVEGDRRRALEVVWVVEVAEHGDETRGFYGRFVDDEALARAANVGTEHLEDGTPVVQPVVSDHSAAMDVSDGMAMPAPVMLVDDDTGVLDVGRGDDDEREEADELAHEPEPTQTVQAYNPDEDDEDDLALVARQPYAADDSPASLDAPAQTRKKRGRKRR